MKLKFFRTPPDFRKWLEQHHATETELLVGFYKKDSGKPSITWPESVKEALCFGWIDGIRKKVDAESYKIRFTPRRAKSTWSAVNIARIAVLTREGRMQPAGVAAFARREETNSARYSFENRESAKLSADDEREFRRDPLPGNSSSAKRSETRRTRLQRIIAESRARRRI